MTFKKKTITIENETQEKVLKEALDDKKFLKKIGVSGDKSKGSERREQCISEIYELEKLEKQLEN